MQLLFRQSVHLRAADPKLYHEVCSFANGDNRNSRHAALLIRGLPVDSLVDVPTPADGRPSSVKATYISEAVLLSATRLIGCEPAGYT